MTPVLDREASLLVQRAGGTPVYVYSRAEMTEAVARVRAASVPDAQIFYSLKANPHVGVVSHLTGLVDGFDVCSLRELATALDLGAAPEQVLFTGPAKSRQEAAASLAAGVCITVESTRQARLVAAVAAELDVPGRAVVRLNTPYPSRDGSTPPLDNQFGVSEQDVDEVVGILRGSRLAVEGIQVFWGSQYTDAPTIVAARDDALRRVRALAARLDLDLRLVSIGGGIATPWCDEDPEVGWDVLAAASGAPDAPRGDGAFAVVCEYGRSIVGPAGSLVTAVLDTKTVGGRRYVLVDAGMNHLLIASRLVAGGSRGEPRVRVLAPRSTERVASWVTGPLCSQIDVLAADVLLPAVEPGDLLAFDGVGAYGPSFSPSGFLSRDPVREIVY